VHDELIRIGSRKWHGTDLVIGAIPFLGAMMTKADAWLELNLKHIDLAYFIFIISQR